MTSKEALKSICLECEIWKGKNKVSCPFRSISNDYCEEYETIKRDLEVLELLKRELFNEHQCFDLDAGWYDDSFSFSKNEQKKIKEWLENER